MAQASENALDGISLVQTADGAMNEIHELLQRCNELAVKAANGTLTTSDRANVQDEVAQLAKEIERITDSTKFNARPVLQGEGDGSIITTTIPQGNSLPSWVGMGNANGVMSGSYTGTTYTDGTTGTFVAATIDFAGLNANPPTGTIDDLNGKGFHFTCCTCDKYYSVQFDTSTSTSKVEEPTNNCYIYTVGIQGAASAADVLSAMNAALGLGGGDAGWPQKHYTEMKIDGTKAVFHDNRPTATPNKDNGRGVFDQQTVISSKTAATNFSVTLQIGADTEEASRLKIDMPNMTAIQTTSFDVSTPEKARQTIDIVELEIQYVSTERSRMGAYQNRLEHTIANLDNVVENTQAAESRLRDTDMATEMVRYSNLSILEQAGQALMAQANQMNQGVLQLLQQ